MDKIIKRRIVQTHANTPANPILLSSENKFWKSILVRLKTKSKTATIKKK